MILFNSKSVRWAWLSNFSQHPIVDRAGVTWPTVEHAYQAMKTLDAGEREIIRSAPDAGVAKARGRGISERAGWKEMRVDVMKRLLMAKFNQHAELRNMLLATDNEPLVHSCPWGDCFWGVCRGEGKNVMGVLLMEIREAIR